MRNPFRTEVEAFHFLLLTVTAFAAIAVASLVGGTWAGLLVWGLVTVAAVIFYLGRRRSQRPEQTAPVHTAESGEWRILVVADETLGEATLGEEIERAAHGLRKRVNVLCPAVTSSVHHWMSDFDHERAQAQERLDDTLRRLRAAGITAQGEVGDDDPLQAIADTLRTFAADEIIISTRPEGDSSRLVQSVRERYALPVSHVVIEAPAAAPH